MKVLKAKKKVTRFFYYPELQRIRPVPNACYATYRLNKDTKEVK